MSLIAHLCVNCGHPDFWRSGAGSAVPGRCSCGCACTPGPPELRPSFDQAGNRVERIIPPGEKIGGHFSTPLCGCQGCKDLYEQQTAA